MTPTSPFPHGITSTEFDAFRERVKTAIETFSGSPIKKQGKLNSACATILGFKNSNAMFAAIEAATPKAPTSPYPDLDKELTYLTNGCCEYTGHAHVELIALGLPTSEWEGEFYPLVEEEASYIADDTLFVCGFPVFMGYSVLYKDKKALCPSLRVPYNLEDEADSGEWSYEEAFGLALQIADTMKLKMGRVGGALDVKDEHGSVEVRFVLPFDLAYEKADSYEQWVEFLEKEFFGDILIEMISLDLDAEGPVRFFRDSAGEDYPFPSKHLSDVSAEDTQEQMNSHASNSYAFYEGFGYKSKEDMLASLSSKKTDE